MSQVKIEHLSEAVVRKFLETLPREQIFSVTFAKKDGTLRRMTCRRDVRKNLKGGESTISGHANLVSVFDMEADGYRCFDVTRVILIRGGGAELATAPEIEAYDGRGHAVTVKAKTPPDEEE